MIWETVIQPFADFGFMRRALLGCIAISLGATPIGVFLMLRRISLTGCAMAAAVLPGAATSYLLFGLSLVPMTFGGLGAGLAVALLSGFVTRRTQLREDASLAAFSLIALALGVLIVFSTRCAQPCRGLPCTRHTHGGGYHATACHRRTVLD